MRKKLLENLVCPASQSPLRLISPEWDEAVTAGTLRSQGGNSYAIRHGIPCFVSTAALQSQTVRSFSEKWAKHRYYREHTREFYTQWYLQRYGFGDLAGLRGFLADKRHILDAGTGAGRDAVNLADCSNALVYAIDTSWDALENASREVSSPRICFIHADLHELPFADGFFDFINCDQVIHHTPDPRKAFAALSRKLAPGGAICCYVYKRKAAIREFTDDYVRGRLSGLSLEEAMQACESITRLGRTLAGLHITLDVEEDIPILGIKKGKIDLQRFFHWNVLKCFWNEGFDFFTNNIVNVDWYHPEHCHRFEPQEFRKWFDEGWEIQAWDVQDAGISCRARKL